MITSLESQYDPLLDIEEGNHDDCHILVLGSGHTYDPDLPPSGQLSATALKRLTEGIRIHEQTMTSTLILSGYSGASSHISQAEVMAQAAGALGIENDKIKIHTTPTTTAEEADVYLEKYGMKHCLILVTSASHMPRAMRIFQNRGLKPYPAPADFMVKIDPSAGFRYHLFSHQNFYKVKLALHEYIGMLWERIQKK